MSERKETYSLDWSMKVEIGSELDLLLRKCSPNDIPKVKNTSHKHFFICDDLDWANPFNVRGLTITCNEGKDERIN